MDVSAQYRDAILKLFPKGKVWFAEPGSLLYSLAWGAGDELARLQARALQLIEEADPRTTQEMLADWQRAMGLPDSCCPPGQSSAQQRFEVIVRFKGGYGNSPQAFINIAADLGFTVMVTPWFAPFQVGSGYATNCKVGGALTNGDWRYAFKINGQLNGVVSHFQVGRNVVGDRLASWGNTQLECKISQAAPAHSIVVFAYA